MIKKIIYLFLAVSMFLAAAGCTQPAVADQNFVISIITEGGMPLGDAEVIVYEDKNMGDLVWRGETSPAGKVSFTAPYSDTYVAVVGSLPNGYRVDEYYTVDSVDKIITPEILLEEKDDLTDIRYGLGDIIHDFTVTDYNGTEHRLSELLKVNKAVVLNFWYINCGPCKMEFPYLEEAYRQYSDKLEILALNPLDGTNNNIQTFASENELTFPMVACDPSWEGCMELTAYPTTVVIDRYGSVAMIHKGYITETEMFTRIFEFFTSDGYLQTTVRNISDIE